MCGENSVGSRLRLPLGGYGLSGVCTDSPAAVEFALLGTTGVYPILGIGGYKSHVVGRAAGLGSFIEKRRKNKQSFGDTPPRYAPQCYFAAVLLLSSHNQTRAGRCRACRMSLN